MCVCVCVCVCVCPPVGLVFLQTHPGDIPQSSVTSQILRGKEGGGGRRGGEREGGWLGFSCLLYYAQARHVLLANLRVRGIGPMDKVLGPRGNI